MKQDFKKPWNKILHKFGVEVSFEQMKLVDGVTTLEAEAFEPDYSVGIVTADGIVPAPIGVYETVDGVNITVEVEGQIKSVVAETAADEAKETPAEAAAEPAEKMSGAVKKTVETVSKETFFAEVGAELQVEFEAISKAKDDVIAGLKIELEAVKLELSEAGAKAITHNPESKNAKTFAEMTGLEKHRFYKQQLNN